MSNLPKFLLFALSSFCVMPSQAQLSHVGRTVKYLGMGIAHSLPNINVRSYSQSYKIPNVPHLPTVLPVKKLNLPKIEKFQLDEIKPKSKSEEVSKPVNNNSKTLSKHKRK